VLGIGGRGEGRKEADSGKASPGIWVKCPECGEILYRKEVEQARWVCGRCQYHFGISRDGMAAREYVDMLVDPGSFEELFAGITSLDPLEFKDSLRYRDRVAKATAAGGREAIITGRGTLEGDPVLIAVMDFTFLGGSMASAVGEKISRMLEAGIRGEIPAIIVSSSGGARMQEGILSLMQMAKTSAQLARLAELGVAYVAIQTHPTTGGVTASFASLGDFILAEPRALIGFAGPRVIEQTIRQELPEGFQRSEFLLDHGFVDRIVTRGELRSTVASLLRWCRDAREGRNPS
jgi:acetyl-CoA carboxylase carboxyl transferase subunit beta